MSNALNISRELAHQHIRISALEIEMGDCIGAFFREPYKNGINLGNELKQQHIRISNIEIRLGDYSSVLCMQSLLDDAVRPTNIVEELCRNEYRIGVLEKKLNIDKIKDRVKNFINKK